MPSGSRIENPVSKSSSSWASRSAPLFVITDVSQNSTWFASRCGSIQISVLCNPLERLGQKTATGFYASAPSSASAPRRARVRDEREIVHLPLRCVSSATTLECLREASRFHCARELRHHIEMAGLAAAARVATRGDSTGSDAAAERGPGIQGPSVGRRIGRRKASLVSHARLFSLRAKWRARPTCAHQRGSKRGTSFLRQHPEDDRELALFAAFRLRVWPRPSRASAWTHV